ncbi:DUF1523 family protein [uncultured Deefgea sp.]|uniref:DUF1523 family protein n=1 Tax=uncultured Deefgea sp. TaxID=1304914 RepID=UPI002591683E|nr:DUF1523 family protein [uncultured Deefgea sp.]
MLKLRKVLLMLLALMALVGTVALDCFLPEKTITSITGVEVKLTDKDGPISKANPSDGPTVDVYYIYTNHATDIIRVFKNIDTGWGWPYYFKFNSADLQAKAKTLEFEKKPALVTSYGWRFDMMSWFPNVVDIQVAEPDSSTWSFWRWLGFSVWVLLLLIATFAVYRVTRPKNKAQEGNT